MAGLRTILCIEDEHFISELYSRALRKAGYEVTIMLSGSDGLLAAQTDNYDLVLLDLMPPGITGMEVLDTLIAYTRIMAVNEIGHLESAFAAKRAWRQMLLMLEYPACIARG